MATIKKLANQNGDCKYSQSNSYLSTPEIVIGMFKPVD